MEMSDLRTKLIDAMRQLHDNYEKEYGEYPGADFMFGKIADAALEVLRPQLDDAEKALFSTSVEVAKEIFSKYQIVANDPSVFAVMDRNGSEEMWADYLAEQFAPIIALREAALRDELATLRTDYGKNLTLERDAKEAAQKRVDELEEENAKLSKFKTYVHTRLDEMGIPEHQEMNAINGCRIGSRLDDAWMLIQQKEEYYEAQIEATRQAGLQLVEHGKKENAELRAQLAKTANQLTQHVQGLVIWTKVEEGLPDNEEACLVLIQPYAEDAKPYITITHLNKSKKAFYVEFDPDGNYPIETALMWTKLPHPNQ